VSSGPNNTGHNNTRHVFMILNNFFILFYI